ncbi:MAG: hypothetical protein ACE5IZ_06190 [Dehalococcoidia bacterium]
MNCLNCGRFLGIVEGRKGRPMKLVRELERPVAAGAVRCGPASVCCDRCGGRAIVESVEEIPDSLYQDVFAL